jgi:hypothetical protein
MAPIPKRSDQLHGHRKPPKVTKIAAAPRWIDQDGNICYATVEPADIPCRAEPPVIYPRVRLRPGIEFEPDPGEEV